MTQLHALFRVFRWERVFFYDVDPSVSDSFVRRVAPFDLGSVEIQSVRLAEVISQADILCVATSVEAGKGLVFDAAMETKPWLHINAVGSDFPGKTGIPIQLLNECFVCLDFMI